MQLKMATFEISSNAHGYHVYQPLWTATIGDNQTCTNKSGRYAVAVLLDTFLKKILTFFNEERVLLV